MSIIRAPESVGGLLTSCGAALTAGWGSYFSLPAAQTVLGIIAAIAATVYSVYMSYDLYDRRQKARQNQK